MMKITSRCVLAVLLAMGLTAELQAKGRTVKLSVTGPLLATAVDVTDPAALANVWGISSSTCAVPRNFYGANASAPKQSLARYRVSFHVLPAGDKQTRVMYEIAYVFDPGSNRGYVYFPGPGEDGYELNSGTIVRAENAGKWYEAGVAWSKAINAQLAPALAPLSLAPPN
jgi:hypothetical protein